LPPVISNTHPEYVKKAALEQNDLMPKFWLMNGEIGKNGSFMFDWEAYGNTSWL
jgi:hypothetical protein